MLGQCPEMMAQQRATPRWKEWIPLVSQQLRLRNLIQVIAYNVNVNMNKKQSQKYDCRAKKQRTENLKASFYYTLHLTTMSAPFYTSERLESENPKWAEIEINDVVSQVNASVNGIVVRLWSHRNAEQDQVLTVWGVYFSGLVYLGPKLCSDPTTFCFNTIVFYMQGGYFTAPQCFKEPPQKVRCTKIALNSADIRPSYTVSLLSRLHTIQQAIKKQMLAAQNLKEKISAGGYTTSESRENAVLCRLLNKTRPRAPQRQELLKARQELETTKFRVEMLGQELSRKQKELEHLEKAKDLLLEANLDKASDLMNKYQALHRELECLKEWRKSYVETREAFLHTNAQLIFRRKQLITELSHIYPISQISNGRYTICGVHLPNSEDFAGNDEVMISVALGFVAHVVQMISIFLQVPLRYPVILFGSRSKIIDHVVEKIPEKDREFPLFSRGKDKLQFNYGVYLLNKNIAQLRWYCGLPTHDLRATLSNLMGLLHLRPGPNVLEAHHRTSSGSSLDLRSSSQNQSPVGSVSVGFWKQPKENRQFEKGHRISKSMGSSELQFQTITTDPEIQSVKDFTIVSSRDTLPNGSSVTASLSYSLDKGLDEYEEIKKSEDTTRLNTIVSVQQRSGGNLGHVGSEPILTRDLRNKIAVREECDTMSSGDEAQKHFLQNWQAGGPAPVCSDDDLEVLQQSRATVALFSGHPDEEHKHGSVMNITAVSMEQTASILKDNEVMDGTDSRHQNLEIDNLGVGARQSQQFILSRSNSDDKENKFQYSQLQPINDMDSVVCFSHELVSKNKIECSELNNDEIKVKAVMNNTVENNANFVFPESIPNSSSNVRKEKGDTLIESSVEKSSKLLEESVSLEDITDLIDSTVLVDSMFASVTSRTEILANRSGTFNLVRSRHSSLLEDGPS